jgi:dipeptidase D
MSDVLAELEPKLVWQYFDKILRIPHGSRNERALGEAVMAWAADKGCEAAMDDVGNVVVRIGASKGFESAPTVVLQGHLDMVCEKNSDKQFDFEKDAIQPLRDGDWITADGTTLGADNGIGVAIGLALMEMPDLAHGPIELLMTVDEETGLNGAVGLRSDFVKGRKMINLDSEDDGVFYVGCAGGRDAEIKLPIAREAAAAGSDCLKVVIKGLRGGHSGLDIVHNRGNAIQLLARALDALPDDASLRLSSLEGGDKHNAIPREATAVVQVAAGKSGQVEKVVAEQLEGFRMEHATAEPDLTAEVTEAALPGEVLGADSSQKVLALVQAIPSGVVAMSRDIVGLVETSNNLARVRTEGDALTALTSTRSSVASAIDGTIAKIQSVGRLAGAEVEASGGYPGWQPNMESELLATGKKVWTEVHGKEPGFTAIHAGLECGIIGEKFPGMDMISIGPDIENPHSPDERVRIATVGRVFDFVTALLTQLTRG